MDFKKYLIFNMEEVDKINFLSTCQLSSNNVRTSLDGSKGVVSWWSSTNKSYIPSPNPALRGNLPESSELDNDAIEAIATTPPDPNFIELLDQYWGPYTNEEVSSILSTPEWEQSIV